MAKGDALTLDQLKSRHSGAIDAAKTQVRQSATQQQERDNVFTDFGQGAAKSYGSSLFGLGKIGRGIQRGISKGVDSVFGTKNFGLGNNSPFDQGTAANQRVENALTRNSRAEKFGGFVGDVSQFAIPSARIGRIGGLSRGQQIAGRAASSGTVASAQQGEVGRDAFIAAGTEAAIPAAAPLFNYGKGVLKGLAGTISGTGDDVIERAFQNPTAAREGLKATDEQALSKTAQAVRQGVKDLKAKAGREYENLTSSVKGNLDGNKLKNQVKDFFVSNVDATPTKAGLSFKNSPLLDAEERQLEKVYRVIQDWDDNTPKGINALATKISRFRRGSEDSQNFDLIIDNLRRSVREFVGEQRPEIADANRLFSDKMDLIDELDSILKVRGAVDSRQGLRETSQRIARLFNSNKELSRQAVDELEKEIGLDTLAVEAGRQLSDNASRFQIGASDGAMQLVRTLIPRSVIGNIVTRTGQTYQGAEQVLGQNLSRLDDASRGVVVEMLTDLFGQGEPR